MEKHSMKSNLKKSMSENAKTRRRTAIESLKKQLGEGTKPNKEAIIPANAEFNERVAKNPTKSTIKKEFPYVALTSKDRERIQKEIAVLETRI